MNNSEKLLKMLSGLIETGVLTSQDIAKALLTSVKFNKEKFLEEMNLDKVERGFLHKNGY